MPSKHVPVEVVYGSKPTIGKMNVGDTFPIFTNEPGKFEFEFTAGEPFDSPEPPKRRSGHKENEKETATIEGKFPFRCFINGKEFKDEDGKLSLAGLLELPEG